LIKLKEALREWVEHLLNSVIVIDDDSQNAKDAVKLCGKMAFDVALVDIELPDIKGTELLIRLKLIQPKMVNIIITGHPSIENAMEAVNEKADGYILKPFEIAKLLETMKKLVEERTNAYFEMFKEVEHAKEDTPIFRYQHPDKW
jgi:DNA-binding NtrC family response regulator